MITLTRDLPCAPYTSDDVAAVEKFASFVGAAIARAQAAQAAWRRRRVLVASVSELGCDVTAAVQARDLMVPDGSAEIICDVDGRILCANKATGAFGGVDATTLIGTPIHDLVVDEEQPREQQLLTRLMLGELAFADTDRTVVTDYGDRVRFAVHRGVVRNAASEPVALVVVANPIPDPEERTRIWPAAS